MSAVRLRSFADLVKVFMVDEIPTSKSANEKMAQTENEKFSYSLGFDDCEVEKLRVQGETYWQAKERLRQLWKIGKHPDQSVAAVELS